MGRIVIVGCGYTGRRVARLITARGDRVTATSRNVDSLKDMGVDTLRFELANDANLEQLRAAVSADTRVLLSTPMVDARLADAVRAASRVVFISTTGVYGSQTEINEASQPAPITERERARFLSEEFADSAKCAMILRPAAIYGPHRGIHASMCAGTYRLAADGGNYVSRIHVDDLAALVVAALYADARGTWPVADEDPCTSREIAAFCAELLHVPMPRAAAPEELGETRRTNRRVDGSAVCRLLGVALRYPSYRTGIPACISAEAVERAF